MAVPEPDERGSDCETRESSSNHEEQSHKEAKDCKGRESQHHGETKRKNSRTSSHEDKVEMENITSKYKVVNYVDKKTWSGTQISSK